MCDVLILPASVTNQLFLKGNRVRNLSYGHGNEYLSYAPMPGKAANEPAAEACAMLDGWTAVQY